MFFLGAATTSELLCGLVLPRAGTGRALRHRWEHRRLRSLERERGQRRNDEQADGAPPRDDPARPRGEP